MKTKDKPQGECNHIFLGTWCVKCKRYLSAIFPGMRDEVTDKADQAHKRQQYLSNLARQLR